MPPPPSAGADVDVVSKVDIVPAQVEIQARDVQPVQLGANQDEDGIDDAHTEQSQVNDGDEGRVDDRIHGVPYQP